MSEQITVQPKRTPFSHFFNEVFEAFISVVIVTLVTRHKFKIMEVLKLSVIIGSITFFLEYYDHSFKNDIKKGMTFSIGGKLLS